MNTYYRIVNNSETFKDDMLTSQMEMKAGLMALIIPRRWFLDVHSVYGLTVSPTTSAFEFYSFGGHV